MHEPLRIRHSVELHGHPQNAERLDSEIIYNRDFDYDYFGFKVRCKMHWVSCASHHFMPGQQMSFADGAQTLERSYLLRINGTVVERPQHMLMRVAVGIHKQVCARPA